MRCRPEDARDVRINLLKIMDNACHLGAGYTYLRSSIDVDSTVGLPADGGANSVGDPNDQGAPVLAVPQSCQSVRCLSRLGDEDTCIIPEYWGISVKEVRCQVCHHS